MIWTLIGFLCATVLGVLSTLSAYRNGVCDGYGYSQEPSNPGYQKAGRYLRKHMVHRWSHLSGKRPTIEELDKILNSEDHRDVEILPNGSIKVR